MNSETKRSYPILTGYSGKYILEKLDSCHTEKVPLCIEKSFTQKKAEEPMHGAKKTLRDTQVQAHTIHQLEESVGVSIFGKPLNWRGKGAHELIAGVVESHGIGIVYCPDVTGFTGEAVEMGEFYFYRQPRTIGRVTLHHKGLSYDGIVTRRRAAIAIPVGDCPVIVMSSRSRGLVGAAHAGRDSLLDVSLVQRGIPRKYPSIVDAMMAHFTRHGSASWEIQVLVTCCIEAQRFTHPLDHPDLQRRTRNNDLATFLRRQGWERAFERDPQMGCLNLRTLIDLQFAAHGVHTITHDTVGTGVEELWSHRRGEEGRNLVLVTHNL